MKATQLRYILLGCIALMLAGFSTGAWWLQGKLAASVKETDRVTIDAEIATEEFNQLSQLKDTLQTESTVVARANHIAASRQIYQEQIIQDMSSYAARHGISINNIDFAAATNPQQAAASAQQFGVTLRGPVPYTNFIRFLYDVESSLPKLHVISLTLTPAENPAFIADPLLTMEVNITQ